MSNLSWLIYLIGLSENIGAYFGWITAPLFVMAIGAIVFRLVLVFNGNDRDFQRIEESHGRSIRRYAIILVALFFSSVIFYMIIPNKRTSVMIAASEVGQRMLQSEEAKAVGNRVSGVIDPSLGLLQTWIKKETYDQQQQLERMMTPQENKRN